MEKADVSPLSASENSFGLNRGEGDIPPVGVAVKLVFDVTAGDIERLRRHPILRDRLPASATPRLLKSTYLDTRDHAFGRAGFSFRLSNETGRLVQTIEAPRHGVLQRFEKQHAPSSENGLTVSEELLARLGGDHLPTVLQPVFSCEIRRRSCRIGGIRISLDTGRVVAGDNAAGFHTFELDLQRGSRADLFSVARQILANVSADLAVRSVAQYGYQLLDGGKITPIRSTAVALTPNMSAAEGATTILSACLSQLLANRAGVCAGNPDSLHAMRVAARRLDAVIRIFSEVLDVDDTGAIARELKWLGSELGKVRELDVFLAEAVIPLAHDHPKSRSVAALHRRLARQQRAAYAQVKAILQSDRFRGFALQATEWADGECFVGSLQTSASGLTARAVVSERLSRQKRKMRNGADLDELDPPQRHKLRLRAKRMRYAMELTRGLFDSEQHAPLIDGSLAALERLQTALGKLNDQAGWKQMLDSSAGVPRKRTRSQAQLAISQVARLLSHDRGSETKTLLKASVKAYRAFARSQNFWID